MGSMVWGLLGAGLLLGAALGAFGYRCSTARGAVRRTAEGFIWAGIASIAVMAALQELLGFAAFVALAAVDLVLVWVAFRLLREPATADADRLWLASLLLVAGSAVVWMGAATWPGGELGKIAANRSGHMFTTGTFLAGALATLAGFVILRGVMHERGERTLADLGVCALVVGAACWSAHLAFRATVVLAVATPGGAPPDWYLPLRMWSGGMYAIYMTLAYLATAAFGAAMLKTGLAGRRCGRAFVILGLAAAAGFVAQTGAFNPPLLAQFLPYVMGIVLLRHSARAATRSEPCEKDGGDSKGTLLRGTNEEQERRLRMVLEKFGNSALGNLKVCAEKPA